MTWTIQLPYTKPPLSLNDRYETVAGRRRHSALVKRVRVDTKMLARAQRIPAQEAIHVTLHYRPRDNRRRDPENLVATQKPAIDGLVEAGIVKDDSPEFVSWSAPVIHTAVQGQVGSLWLTVEAR